MSEIRLYVTTTEKQAAAILDLMTFAFDEDDLAIATTEIDEKKDIWEASALSLTGKRGDEMRGTSRGSAQGALPGHRRSSGK